MLPRINFFPFVNTMVKTKCLHWVVCSCTNVLGKNFCQQNFPLNHKFSSLTHYVYVHELSGYASLIHILLTLSLSPSLLSL